MVVRDVCPACGSTQFKKNGHIHSGRQNRQCKAWGRQFVASAEGRIIADERRMLIEHLLRERISLRGICRAELGSDSRIAHAEKTVVRVEHPIAELCLVGQRILDARHDYDVLDAVSVQIGSQRLIPGIHRELTTELLLEEGIVNRSSGVRRVRRRRLPRGRLWCDGDLLRLADQAQ